GAALVTLGGLASSNSFGFYDAPATLTDSTALGANPIFLSGCTMTVSNDLNLTAAEAMTFTLGSNAATIVVRSNLALNGAINISAGSGFSSGSYTLFTYGGSLTWGGVSFGRAPSGYTYAFDTNSAWQVIVAVQWLKSLSR